MPDASVLVAGGGAPDPVGAPDKNTHAELYLPSYLFDSTGQLATRPVVNSAPATLQVGQAFQIDVGSMDARRVTIVKSGSVTHSVNMDQRFIELLVHQFERDPFGSGPCKPEHRTAGLLPAFRF